MGFNVCRRFPGGLLKFVMVLNREVVLCSCMVLSVGTSPAAADSPVVDSPMLLLLLLLQTWSDLCMSRTP